MAGVGRGRVAGADERRTHAGHGLPGPGPGARVAP